MVLIERDPFLAILTSRFRQVTTGEGHCIFVTGEAGLGKTSLVRAFLKENENESIEYSGSCDSLFTPRPLAPLYDIALQMKGAWTDKIESISSRAELFTRFLEALTQEDAPVVLLFEDIHWADEATLDFIKFLSRRISRTKCLFVITYRENEISPRHLLKNISGDLAPGTFTFLPLTPLSRQAVQKMADEKGFDGEDVYAVSGGNPFYVSEILASYSSGIPDNIKNAVLSVYNRQEEKTKEAWQLLSIIPEGLELTRLAKIDASLHEAIESSLEKKILLIENGKIFFKHELYRRAIEGSFSAFKRIALNKHLLDLFLKTFQEEVEMERIVHYARQANENEVVVKYAPIAARKAAAVGAHIEASKLYFTAIEHANKVDNDNMVGLYESYAYECYLTSQVKNAIVYTEKALQIWKEKKEQELIGNSLRFLSRLWWLDGDRKEAENYGRQAIAALTNEPDSRVKALAFSNMSQLKNAE